MGARAKITWGIERCKTSNVLHSDPGSHGTIKHHHRGKEHDPPHRRFTTLLGTSTHTYHTGEVFFSLTFSFTFHLHTMLTGALYTSYRYRHRYLPAEKNPHLLLLHHSHIGLTLHKIIFWSVKIFWIIKKLRWKCDIFGRVTDWGLWMVVRIFGSDSGSVCRLAFVGGFKCSSSSSCACSVR